MRIMLLILLTVINLNAKTITQGDTKYTCKPVKTCDEKLQQAYAEIKRLKQQIKNQKTIIKTETMIKEIPTEKRVYIVQEKTKIKKHIISGIFLPSIIDTYADKTSINTAKAQATVSYGLGITYQYQFDIGLTPMIGVSIFNTPKIFSALGWEF